MMAYSFLSPLREIIETQTYPHARTLRTTFLQKLRDTSHVLLGKPSILSPKPHVGIFDYLTLYIPFVLYKFFELSLENARKNSLFWVLAAPLFLIGFPFDIARLLFVFAVTLMFSPIIAIVHGISRLAAGQSHTDALSLQGQLQNGKGERLGQFLNQHYVDLEELNITITPSYEEEKPASQNEENGSSSYQLTFCKKGADDPLPFTVVLRQENGVYSQAKNIHALFRLNAGNVVGNIEEASIADKQAILAI
ncbi:hypothetical protein Lgee_1875 [Legionella geestiana]|uniref:Uncharacterized protein n=1 Tax=Legionella geestiana TaxID=45065 RepID=A0A0W0TNN9_9GAMM|nr:hypothetical protein [Legionella geestiana]KTC97214.1 hypothetical protein Lgee_1875 [Legionella geestiana]QBS12348.1 hypothetical protein E4T54_06100 [Legionella geestiana]QDQ39940.1 hypothetical protein E3226_005765 [Legionella geestiana]STX55215.1 Uncharacterised protein [Legionella geestiana]